MTLIIFYYNYKVKELVNKYEDITWIKINSTFI